MNRVSSFAVVDLETTGLSPNYHHRILEVGIVKIDPSGKITHEYETLINPMRDVGPSDIHGLRPRDFVNAPRFEDVAGDILDLLAESVFVAHNVSFDWRFISAEAARIGVRLPEVPRLCTMDVARCLDSGIPGRSLGRLCEHFRIPLDLCHCALSDARAAAELLTRFLKKNQGESLAKSLNGLGVDGEVFTKSLVAAANRSSKTCPRTRRIDTESDEHSFLSKLVDRLPSLTDVTSNVRAYITALDRALEDRFISQQEKQELSDIANHNKLLREQLQAVHQRYLDDLIRACLEDNDLSDAELLDLEAVGYLLGFDTTHLKTRISALRSQDAQPCNATKLIRIEALRGKLVCFTGTFTCKIDGKEAGRAMAERLAEKHGLVVKDNFVKTLALVVAADVHTMSGKAAKARSAGIPIISEEEYWQLLGMNPEPQ